MATGRVLALDDNEVVLQMVSDVLTEAGFETQVMQIAFGVLNAMREFKPDVLLLDVSMPALGGESVVALINSRPETDCLIVYLSDRSSEELEALVAATGAAGYICKTAMGHKFVQDVQRWVDESKRRRGAQQSVVMVGCADGMQLPGFMSRSGVAVRRVDPEKFEPETLSAEQAIVILRADAIEAPLDLVRKLSETRPRAYVVYLVGSGNADRHDLERHGATVLADPPDPSEFAAKLKQAMSTPSRRTLRRLVDVTVFAMLGNKKHVWMSRNISETGMLLECTTMPRLGTRVSLSFLLPGQNEELIIKAAVVRHALTSDTKDAIGVKFLDLKPEQTAAINAYIGP